MDSGGVASEPKLTTNVLGAGLPAIGEKQPARNHEKAT